MFTRGYNKEQGHYLKRDRALEDKIRQICQEEIRIAIPQITAALSKEIESGVLAAFNYDVQTIADVGIGNIEKMINTDKISSFVSATIAKEVGKRIKDTKIKI